MADVAFVDRAIEAMRDADVSCCRIGPDAYSKLYVRIAERQICIYISNESDYAKANSILVKLGAVEEELPKLPPVWMVAIAAALIVALGYWVALQWN